MELSILEYEPVKVYVDGAVENPGIQVLPGAFSPLNSLEVFNNDLRSENVRRSENQLSVDNNVFFPSVIDALRSSGGIKINADLQNIEITRKNNTNRWRKNYDKD